MINSLKRRLGAPTAQSQVQKIIYNLSSDGTRGGRNRHLGVRTPPKLHHSTSPRNNGSLLAFRIIVVTIITFCLLWGYLIIKIASDMSGPVDGQPTAMLARPFVDKPTGVRGMIKHRINRIQLQLRPVPLLDVARMDSPVLIITYNRADYLERTLWKIFQNHPAQQLPTAQRNGGYSDTKKSWSRIVGAPLIVSQDGDNADVQKVIVAYRQLFELKLGVPLYRIQHAQPSELGLGDEFDWSRPYKLLAAHFGWALEQTFSGSAYMHDQKHNRKIPLPPLPQRVIILEEDIEIADDFFSLMNATADLLDSDDTLLAVSAFNDNGKEQFVGRGGGEGSKRLVRSDFFPGLGWMMSRNVWDGPASHPGAGLKNEWAPGGFWDDWLRESANRRGRQILRPEVSRTFHFGNVNGVSAGANNNMLNKIELEHNDVHWEDEDLSSLEASLFANNYWNRVSRAKVVDNVAKAKSHVGHSDVRIVYSNFEQFKQLAAELDIIQDERCGVPRTGYEGIVELRYGRGTYFIFLTPPYVTGSDRPGHFGSKAWLEYSKESMMQELGIESVLVEDRPSLDWGSAW